MARPPKLSPQVLSPSGPLSTLGQSSQAAGSPDVIAAAVTGSFDAYRTVLGKTVPANVNRARQATGRLLQAVR